jgi:hypothetical protein
MVTIVLLNVDWMWTTPLATLRLTFFLAWVVLVAIIPLPVGYLWYEAGRETIAATSW